MTLLFIFKFCFSAYSKDFHKGFLPFVICTKAPMSIRRGLQSDGGPSHATSATYEENVFICGTGLSRTLSFLWMTVLSLLIFQREQRAPLKIV